MIIGFTGTRDGMTPQQKDAVRRLLAELRVTEARHGDCVGADAEFAELCAAMTPRPRIIAHPGVSAKCGTNDLRANSPHNDEVLPEKTHFARNRNIVDTCNTLVATPKDRQCQPFGGTWYTIKYAGGIPVWIVWPSGLVSEWHGLLPMPTDV